MNKLILSFILLAMPLQGFCDDYHSFYWSEIERAEKCINNSQNDIFLNEYLNGYISANETAMDIDIDITQINKTMYWLSTLVLNIQNDLEYRNLDPEHYAFYFGQLAAYNNILHHINAY